MAAFPPMTETHPNGRWLEFVQGSRHHRLERNLADIASHDRTHRAPHFGEAEQEGTLRPFCAKPRLHSHPVPNALLWAFAGRCCWDATPKDFIPSRTTTTRSRCMA